MFQFYRNKKEESVIGFFRGIELGLVGAALPGRVLFQGHDPGNHLGGALQRGKTRVVFW